MKITLESIDGKQFTLRLPREGDAREHVVALHTTRRLRGVYEQDARAVRLDPVEADEIIGEVAWLLSEGMLRVGGPARLGATSLDVDLALGGAGLAAAGEARCESVSAPAVEVTLGGLDVRGALELGALQARHDLPTDAWAIQVVTLDARAVHVTRPDLHADVARLSLRALDAQVRAGATRLSAIALDAQGLSLALGRVKVTAAGATVTGLRLSREAGALVVEADEVTLTGVELGDGQHDGRAADVRITTLRYAPEGLSFARLDGGELTVALEGLDAISPDGDAPPDAAGRPGAILGFLDLLEGRIEADTRVEVKVPVVHRLVGKHTARLTVSEGAIDFRELEHGLSVLEDAVLDFEVEDDGLVLELDVLLAKKRLVTWPLDRAEVGLARGGRVKLRALLQPVPAMPPKEDGGDCDAEPLVAFQRVEVDSLLVEVALRGTATLPVATGVLRLGAEGVDALEMLSVRGSVAHNAAGTDQTTQVQVGLAGLVAGADDVALGGGRLDLGRLTLGRLTDGVVTLRGFRPSAARATLGELSLRAVRWRPTAS